MFPSGTLTGEAAVDRLKQLGLSPEDLYRAVESGVRAYQNCDEDWPRYFPGGYAHAATVRALRQALRPQGWKRHVHKCIEMVLDSSGGTALGVITGDANTGDPTTQLRQKNKKGSGTQSVVDQNSKQLSMYERLFPQIAPPDGPDASKLKIDGRDYTTYYLVYSFADGSHLVKVELSMPKTFQNGWISEWQQRIILPDLDLTPPPVLEETGGPGGGDGSSIVVEVSRKS